MKLRILLYILLIIILIPFNLVQADSEEELEITPEIVTAHGLFACNWLNGVRGACADIYLEFYNVGQLVEGYGDVEAHLVMDNGQVPDVEGKYFTGGPNGKICCVYLGHEFFLQLVDGTKITGAFEDEDLIVDNPEAFSMFEAVEMTVSVSSPERIDKFCTSDGLRYILTIDATGYPGPIVKITGADYVDIGGDDLIFQVDLCSSPQTIIDIEASNGLNTVYESIILPKACAPEVSLILLEGPTLRMGNYEYVVQATVKGFPIPELEWTNATPLDEKDTTVTVRVPEGEWLFKFPTIYLTAKNSVGEAQTSLKLPVSSLFKGDSGAGFSDISGRVMICPPDKDPWDEDSWDEAEMAELESNIPVGSFIRTWDDSEAWLGFADMSTFHLKPNTTIMISTPPEQESKLKLVTGNIWINFNAMLEGKGLQIQYNQAVAGIKGTILECTETGEESILKVHEGTVSFTSTVTDETVMVNAGEMVTATSEGLSDISVFDTGVPTTTPAPSNTDPSEGEDTGSSSFPMTYLIIGIIVVAVVAIVALSRK